MLFQPVFQKERSEKTQYSCLPHLLFQDTFERSAFVSQLLQKKFSAQNPSLKEGGSFRIFPLQSEWLPHKNSRFVLNSEELRKAVIQFKTQQESCSLTESNRVFKCSPSCFQLLQSAVKAHLLLNWEPLPIFFLSQAWLRGVPVVTFTSVHFFWVDFSRQKQEQNTACSGLCTCY